MSESQKNRGKKFCLDCLPYPSDHLGNWLSDLAELTPFSWFGRLLPAAFFARAEEATTRWLFGILTAIKMLEWEKNAPREHINQATNAFIDAAEKHGVKFKTLKGPWGYLNYFEINLGGWKLQFEKLPILGSAATRLTKHIDDKWVVKKVLEKHGLPFVPGKSFWWFEKNKALRWAGRFDYPVIVKPRRGTLSQHIYFDVQDGKYLADAIKRVRAHSPAFIVERFFPGLILHRITVINQEKIFVVKRLPPSVTGDGVASIHELALAAGVATENIDYDLLAKNGLRADSVPGKARKISLHNKITVSLGATFENVPAEKIHPDNILLFRKIAALFGNNLIGIDMLAQDLAHSWQSQTAAVIELNSLPNIQMHTFERNGTKENLVAEALVTSVLKNF